MQGEAPVSSAIANSAAGTSKLKIILFSSVGNFFELYDYLLYVILMPYISMKFFPTDNPTLSLMIGYLSFAVAFVIAPFGSIFWGWYGDRFGRLTLLRSSMLIMALPSLLIAVLPTYDQIGITAPIVLILLRIMQGISASGEIKGAKIFMMEHMGSKRYGFSSSISSATATIGVMAAMFMGYWVSQHQDMQNAWRIPFLLGAVLCILCFFVRRYLAETPDFKKLLSSRDESSMLGTFKLLLRFKTQSIQVFLSSGVIGMFSYFMHAFIVPHLIMRGVEVNLAYQLNILGLLSTVVGSICFGIMADRQKNHELMFRRLLLLAMLLNLPVYHLMLSGAVVGMQVAFIYFGTLLGGFACLGAVLMFKLFPAQYRCRGVLFNYAFGVSLLGGTAPLLFQFVSGIYLILPAIFLSIMCLLSYFNCPKRG